MVTSVRVKLTFPEHLIRQPIVGRMVKEFDVMPNIRRANIDARVGWMILEIGGDDSHVEHAIEWLTELGVQVDRLADVVES